MAVLDAYPGLTAEVTVNKKPLVEYDHEEEASPTTVTKYIEACSGAEFVIKTKFSEPFPLVNGVEISTTVDGNRGPRWAVEPDARFYRSANNMKGVSFTKDGKRYQQKYQFAELNIGWCSRQKTEVKLLITRQSKKLRQLRISTACVRSWRLKVALKCRTVGSQTSDNQSSLRSARLTARRLPHRNMRTPTHRCRADSCQPLVPFQRKR